MAQRRAASRATPEDSSRRLWAPWRAAWLQRAGSSAVSCIFCFGRLGRADRRARLILYAGPAALVMLNRYPYNNGHLMIAPRRHLASPELLARDERIALGELIAVAVAGMRKVLKPAGFNIGANLGRAAGAGFARHLHYHVVPRWEGDNNFMPAIGGARVISQSLRASFDQLAPLFKAADAKLS